MNPFPFLAADVQTSFDGNWTFVVLAKILGLLLLAVATNWIGKNVILRVARVVIRRTKVGWDDVLLDSGVLTRLSHILPAIIVQLSAPFLFDEENVLEGIRMAVSLYLIFIFLFVFDGVMNAIHFLIIRTERGKQLPIRGFVQAIKLFVNLVGLVFVVSVLFGKTPIYILSGLGALTAVFILVFRDAILGFVAGIQISVNSMVRQGDWIEMPSNDANGDVMDVSLTTVKVRNFDKTITSIPAYDMISKSFINWRGMEESGGRRIRRAIRIDMRTVQFVDDELLEKLRHVQVLQPYLEERTKEIEEWNAKHNVEESERINGRRLTNIGCFRAYCLAYLRNHSMIRKDMTFLVRQLDPDGEGLPLQIYVFTATTNWSEYESIQSDVFDHLLAALPQFNLSVFQQLGGRDITEAFRSAKSRE